MSRADQATLAHGIGGASDLPISPELAIAGAMAALTISFTVLALAWRRPRYDGRERGRPAPGWIAAIADSTALLVVARTFGFAMFGYTAFAAVFGPDLLINPALGIIYVLLWVGIVPLSLLFGSFWKAISPVRTINAGFAKLTGSDPDEGVFDFPAWLGLWPAAIGLFSFVWLELVYPYNTEVGSLRLWCAIYVAAMLIGGALFGNRWYAHADPFEVYSTLVGKLSVWGRRDDGRLVILSPLANLATVRPQPGLVAVAAVLFGSTAFDSLHTANFWVVWTQNSTVSSFVINNVVLLGFCLLIGGIIAAACMATGVGPEVRRIHLPGQFAHSIVPIIVGYMVAHYLTYFVEVGQRTVIQMSDPLGNGSNWLGTGDWSVNYWLTYHPTLLAVIKVLGVVVGHLVAVVSSHDRAIHLLPARHQLTGQLPLLVAMVAFTGGGLFLLFAA